MHNIAPPYSGPVISSALGSPVQWRWWWRWQPAARPQMTPRPEAAPHPQSAPLRRSSGGGEPHGQRWRLRALRYTAVAVSRTGKAVADVRSPRAWPRQHGARRTRRELGRHLAAGGERPASRQATRADSDVAAEVRPAYVRGRTAIGRRERGAGASARHLPDVDARSMSRASFRLRPGESSRRWSASEFNLHSWQAEGRHATTARCPADMDQLSRREFIQTAFALGATAAVAGVSGKPSTTTWHERRDLFPRRRRVSRTYIRQRPALDPLPRWHGGQRSNTTPRCGRRSSGTRCQFDSCEPNGGSRYRPGLQKRRRRINRQCHRSKRLDLPRARRRSPAVARVLVSLHG